MIKYSAMLEFAIRCASIAHTGQFDKGGKPYILHPLAVMHKLNTGDYELMAIAVLHDVIEDTPTTYADLRAGGLSERIIKGVTAMTKAKGDTYDEYRSKVMVNPDAVKVKMADLEHNSDLRRLKGVTEKDVARVAKYMKFYDELKGCL